MIILGPPLESREPTRLRSVMSKNLQEFAYRCVFAVSRPGGRAKSSPSHPRSQFFRLSSSLLFRYVYVCMCIYCSRVLSLRAFRSPRSLADEFSTARQCATSCVVLPRVPRFPMDILFYESASCHPLGPPGTLPFLHAIDVDLKVGRFLVSLIPERSMKAIRTIRDTWRGLKRETQGILIATRRCHN